MENNLKKISKIDSLNAIQRPTVSFGKDTDPTKGKKRISRSKKLTVQQGGLENNKILKKWNKLNDRIIYKRKENAVQKFSYINLFIFSVLALPIITTFVKVIKFELHSSGFPTNIVVCKPSTVSSNNTKIITKTFSSVPVFENFKNNIFLDFNTIGAPGIPHLISEKSFCNDLDSLVFLFIGGFLGPFLLFIYLASIFLGFGSSWSSFKDFLKGQIKLHLTILLPFLIIAFICYFYFIRLPGILGFSLLN